MSRKCPVINKKPLSGNQVSHANNRTRRRFLPNLQTASFYSEKLKKKIKLRLSVRAIRSIEKQGGIDVYLANSPSHRLSNIMKRFKDNILRSSAAK